MKPPVHLLEISIFSLNNVTVRLTKIMNNLLEGSSQMLKINWIFQIFFCEEYWIRKPTFIQFFSENFDFESTLLSKNVPNFCQLCFGKSDMMIWYSEKTLISNRSKNLWRYLLYLCNFYFLTPCLRDILEAINRCYFKFDIYFSLKILVADLMNFYIIILGFHKKIGQGLRLISTWK